jgi:serine/threonine protein kinase
MYTLLIGKPPFQTNDVKAIYKNIRDNLYDFPEGVEISASARNVIVALLNTKPECRPSIDDVMEHEFFTDGKRPDNIPVSAKETRPDLRLKVENILTTEILNPVKPIIDVVPGSIYERLTESRKSSFNSPISSRRNEINAPIGSRKTSELNSPVSLKKTSEPNLPYSPGIMKSKSKMEILLRKPGNVIKSKSEPNLGYQSKIEDKENSPQNRHRDENPKTPSKLTKEIQSPKARLKGTLETIYTSLKHALEPKNLTPTELLQQKMSILTTTGNFNITRPKAT